jgi:hypothetical protein
MALRSSSVKSSSRNTCRSRCFKRWYSSTDRSTTSGAAAELADVPRPLFLARLADYGVATFDLTADELAHDFANA